MVTFGTLQGIMLAARDGDPRLRAGLRSKLLDNAEYVSAATTVVRLDNDVPVPRGPAPLPRSAADPAALVALSDRYDLDGPVNRLLSALGSAGS